MSITARLLLRLDVSKSPPIADAAGVYSEPSPTTNLRQYTVRDLRQYRWFTVLEGRGSDYAEGLREIAGWLKEDAAGSYSWLLPLLSDETRESLGLAIPRPARTATEWTVTPFKDAYRARIPADAVVLAVRVRSPTGAVVNLLTPSKGVIASALGCLSDAHTLRQARVLLGMPEDIEGEAEWRERWWREMAGWRCLRITEGTAWIDCLNAEIEWRAFA